MWSRSRRLFSTAYHAANKTVKAAAPPGHGHARLLTAVLAGAALGSSATAWAIRDEGKAAAAATAAAEPAARVGVLEGKEGLLFSVAPILNKAVKPEEVDMVLYHGGCPDGFAAALVAWLARGDQAEYIGIPHGSNKKLPHNCDGKKVVILDFSFDADMMKALIERAAGVLVLDHHATAAELLAHLPEENTVFAMNQSGATLAWDFFAPVIQKNGKARGPDCPLLFRYIEDKDIWRWAMKDSKEFGAARELELSVAKPGRLEKPAAAFADWNRAYESGEKGLAEMRDRGKNVIEYQNGIISRAAKGGRVRRLKLAPEFSAYLVNETVLGSEIGNALSEAGKNKNVQYAIVARYVPGQEAGTGRWNMSLRR
eukprot:g7854.t1